MLTRMNSQLEKMKPSLGRTDTNAEEMKSIEVHEEVPKEETSVETSGTLKKWHRDRHITVSRYGQPKNRMQGNGGL
jgi:hypothetical protein